MLKLGRWRIFACSLFDSHYAVPMFGRGCFFGGEFMDVPGNSKKTVKITPDARGTFMFP
jgi:hypothetical protein